MLYCERYMQFVFFINISMLVQWLRLKNIFST